MPLEKARLVPVERNEGKTIEFMFNPTEITFNRTVNIEQAQGAVTQSGQNKTSFKHPNPYQLTISNIILDTYETYETEKKQLSVLKPLKSFTDAVEYAKAGSGKRNDRLFTSLPGVKTNTFGALSKAVIFGSRCFCQTVHLYEPF
jgi:hypothetical protein